MIYLIIKSYLVILLSIGIGTIFIFCTGLYLILGKPKTKSKNSINPCSDSTKTIIITSRDIHAIAGDNVIATQLDLARAYIETGRKHLAKKILQYAIERGSSVQQEEAKQLLNLLGSSLDM